jgi:antitoxin component YwqK of YwqJK toxin-antitoxin module
MQTSVRLFFITSLSLICSFSRAQDTYSNGQVKSKGDRVNGDFIEYYENGNMKSKMSFVNGIITGDATRYFESGAKREVLTVQKADGPKIQNVISAENIQYSEDGKVEEKTTVANGKPNGPWSAYYPSGKIKGKGGFLDGKKHGEWTGYLEDGTVKETAYFLNDNKVTKEVYEANKTEGTGGQSWPSNKFLNGQIKSSGNKTKGEYIEYYPTGQVEMKVTYKKGKRNGPFVKYFLHGQVSEKGQYVNDKQNGDWVIYMEDGNVFERAYYKDGKKMSGESTK